jgi:hypothetical protein
MANARLGLLRNVLVPSALTVRAIEGPNAISFGRRPGKEELLFRTRRLRFARLLSAQPVIHVPTQSARPILRAMALTREAADLEVRLNRIQRLTAELTKCQKDSIKQRVLREKTALEIRAAKESLKAR